MEAKGLSTITQQWRSDIRGTLRSAEEASRCNTIPRAVSEGDAGRGSDSGGKGQARKGPLRMYFHWGCVCVTKRRSSWACVSNPKLEQETIEGTQAQETPAYKRRPTTLHEVQGSNPPIRALYMQLAKIPHTHHTTSRATIAPGTDKPARHPPWAQ